MSTKTESKPQGLVWANIYLDPAQKAAVPLFCVDETKVEDMVSELLVRGYSISYAFNEQTDSFICTFVGKRSGDENEGVGMTSHAGTPYKALCSGLYKHFIVCADCSWLEAAGSFAQPQP